MGNNLCGGCKDEKDQSERLAYFPFFYFLKLFIKKFYSFLSSSLPPKPICYTPIKRSKIPELKLMSKSMFCSRFDLFL